MTRRRYYVLLSASTLLTINCLTLIALGRLLAAGIVAFVLSLLWLALILRYG